MSDQPAPTSPQPAGRRLPDWYPALTPHRQADWRSAAWQILDTVLPYGIFWYLMVRSMQSGLPYIVSLALAVPAAAFLVRIFILFHDCVHNSFFASKRANTFWGYIFGALVFTAFEDWRFSHLRHHGNYANLDARGYGDIWTLTRQEYQTAPPSKRLQYRIYRNPLILIVLGALGIFLFGNRVPTRGARAKQKWSVAITNLLIALMVLVAIRLLGWRTYLLIQLPILWLAGIMGIWLFYVQHQFPKGYWARNQDWQPLRAAMEGSSFYKLPAILRWFSGSIGFHHVHHLSPKIPNYHLKRCYDTIPQLQQKKPLLLRESLACMKLKVWDEKRQQMDGFV